MPTRIVHRNETTWRSRDFRPGVRTSALYLDRDKQPVDCTVGIPADSPESPFRSGVAARDRIEGIMYRIVRRLDPTDGWASTEFWQDRYKVRHRDIVLFVEMGYLDAAIEEGSQIRRYRCRNESGLKGTKKYKNARKRQAERIQRAKVRTADVERKHHARTSKR